jgi:predicted CoA-binding protein
VDLGRQSEWIEELVGKRRWAIVGVSQDSTKFGSRVFRSLRDAGYAVWAVNPRGGELDGAPIYAGLADLPEVSEVVDLVVPPGVTEKVVREAHKLGVTRIWMQPGAESEAAIAFCLSSGIKVVHHACAMVHKKDWAETPV